MSHDIDLPFEEIWNRLSSMVVSEELIDEIARRAAASYFDIGIDPDYLKCLGQPEVDASPLGKMINCIRQAFVSYVVHPLITEEEIQKSATVRTMGMD